MQNILGIKTPSQDEATALKSEFGLENHGLINLGCVYWNLSRSALYEEAVFRREGRMAVDGPLIVATGKKTGRSAQDKFIVRDAEIEEDVWWGEYNRPFSPEKFSLLYSRLCGYLEGKDVFVQDCFVGAHPEYTMPIRIVTEWAWHSLFAKNMFIEPKTNDALRRHVPEFVVIACPNFHSAPEIDGTASDTFIIINFAQRLAIIGGTGYGGEIKKSIFTIMNYLLPKRGVLSMHCSANVGSRGDVALFFGLSGTGKTTLSADPTRRLIGDDEHGWCDEGIFNLEGGCYAKVIGLSSSAEPEIYAATHRFGTILENVIYDPVTRIIDLDDDRLTENTRASYPLEFIANFMPEKMAGHPRNIVLLTCDASGVMPPIARLTPDQAIYHFISGYTAKVSGTEVGMRKDPEITFSACFGGPFMVHFPSFYADLLKRKIERYDVRCWLLNTGWVGGPYGVGSRISIRYTRTLLNSALDGRLEDVEYREDPVFGFLVPKRCEGVPEVIMDPSSSWSNKAEYNERYRALGSLFIENFKKFKDQCPQSIIDAGPHL